ncbi:MAG: hypothetical protein NXH95_13560 [Pseudomonadaceae bacterium]|nr:hypothetical protein [Pseudomonadaceae bacterium]
MTVSFSGIIAKIDRAEQHITELRKALANWMSSSGMQIYKEENLETGWRSYKLRNVPQVPDQLAVIASDVVNQLRGALDQLAFQLEIICGNPSPGNSIYFPIGGNAIDFANRVDSAVPSATAAIKQALLATEVYPGGKGEQITRLNKLAKLDKHRQLIPIAGVNHGIDFAPIINELAASNNMEPPGIKDLWYRPANPFFELIEGATLHSEALKIKERQEIQFRMSVGLGISGAESHRSADYVLRLMLNHVRITVNKFESFF